MTTRRLPVGDGVEEVAVVRRQVRDLLRDGGITETDLAELTTSELVANAIRHATGPRSVVVRCAGRLARVEVHDGSSELPPPADATGRTWSGLAIVDAFNEHWGIDPTPAGKCVWFQVDGRPDPRRSA